MLCGEPGAAASRHSPKRAPKQRPEERMSAVRQRVTPSEGRLGLLPLPACGERAGVRGVSNHRPLTRRAARGDLSPQAGRGREGVYDPALTKASCGVGFIADIKGKRSHALIEDALAILCNLEHRGAVGADPRAGDGAGILV